MRKWIAGALLLAVVLVGAAALWTRGWGPFGHSRNAPGVESSQDERPGPSRLDLSLQVNREREVVLTRGTPYRNG